jgi:hypothetical protein
MRSRLSWDCEGETGSNHRQSEPKNQAQAVPQRNHVNPSDSLAIQGTVEGMCTPNAKEKNMNRKTSKEPLRVMNYPTGLVYWTTRAAVERGFAVNENFPFCFGLQPSDWPEGVEPNDDLNFWTQM